MKTVQEAQDCILDMVNELESCGVSADVVQTTLKTLTLLDEPRLRLITPFLEKLRFTSEELRRLTKLKDPQWWDRAKRFKIKLPELTKRERLEDRLSRLWKKECPALLR